jgi:2-polyprenyl-3-methyl-5-hydroxy-6-metoxy-1,4-benzoquinol methylase
MPIGDAELQDAWKKVLERFPFPEYIKTPRNQVDVARQVSRFLPPGSRVLDFGAGPADKTGVVAVVGYDVTAMDDLQDSWHKKPSSRQAILDYAKDIGINYLPISNGELPPTPDGEFDMVMSHDVVEHLHDPPRYLLNELLQRVRTGGYLYMTVPNAVNIRKRIAVLFGKTNHPVFPVYYWSPIPYRGHLREYTRDDCIHLAKALGLELIEVKGWHQGVKARVPKGLRTLYLAFSTLAPGTRDSWRLIARKPEGWQPKLELAEDEMLSYTGLTCWDDLGH